MRQQIDMRRKIVIGSSIVLAVAMIAIGTFIYVKPKTAVKTTVKKDDIHAPHQPVKPQTPPVAQSQKTSDSISSGWHITTYYTAVESYHHGAAEEVLGCLVRDCVNGSSNLGEYPSDFVEKVKNEGAGRITSGTYAGRYLNWAYDTGYWIDKIPSDTNGNTLQAYISAAADSATLTQGASFQLVDCGTDSSAISQTACGKFKSTTWKVVDHFTPGLGGPRHVDLYIGEENQENFEATDEYVDLVNVSLHMTP